MHDTAIEMAKRMLVDSIWKSANLEGLGTTFPKTEAILANAPTITKTEEVLFVINMKRAWQFLLDNLAYSNCIMLLREYDKIVGELLFNHAGEIRTIPVQIGGTSWEPELPHTGIIMDSMKEIEQIEDIELRALKYFCYIARTQMFIDAHVIIGTRLEKPSKINGFALLSPNFFMPERGERNHHTSTYIVGQQYESLIAIKAAIPSSGDGFEGPKSL